MDPANLVYSYTNDPNFEDIYYVGEIKSMTLAEIKKKFSYLTDEELETIRKRVQNEHEITIEKTTHLTNSKNTIFAEVIKIVYIAEKSFYKEKLRKRAKASS